MSFDVIELNVEFDYPELKKRSLMLFNQEKKFAEWFYNNKAFYQITLRHAKESGHDLSFFDKFLSSIHDALPENFHGYNPHDATITSLRPGYCYESHTDRMLVIHVPLSTNPHCRIKLEDKSYYFEEGRVYLVNTSKMHTAWNAGDTDRIHFLTGVSHTEIMPYDPEINSNTDSTFKIY